MPRSATGVGSLRSRSLVASEGRTLGIERATIGTSQAGSMVTRRRPLRSTVALTGVGSPSRSTSRSMRPPALVCSSAMKSAVRGPSIEPARRMTSPARSTSRLGDPSTDWMRTRGTRPTSPRS
jgi:hypothetical protein